MMDFVEESRGLFGVEPICRTLQIAPSTYYDRRALARDPEARSQGRPKILEEIDETTWPTGDDRHGSASVLRRCSERPRPRRQPRDGALAQQPRGELALTIPTTRAGEVAVPAYANVTVVRLSACLGPQPLSNGAPPPRSQCLQVDPRRRSRRVARPSRCLKPAWGRGNGDWFAFVGQHPFSLSSYPVNDTNY